MARTIGLMKRKASSSSSQGRSSESDDSDTGGKARKAIDSALTSKTTEQTTTKIAPAAIHTIGDQRRSNADHVADHATAISMAASTCGDAGQQEGYHALPSSHNLGVNHHSDLSQENFMRDVASAMLSKDMEPGSGLGTRNDFGGSTEHPTKASGYRGRSDADYEEDYARASSTAASILPPGGDYSPAASMHDRNHRLAPSTSHHLDDCERAGHGWNDAHRRDDVGVGNHFGKSYEHPSWKHRGDRERRDSDRHGRTQFSRGDEKDWDNSRDRCDGRGWGRKRNRNGPYDDSRRPSSHRDVFVSSREWDRSNNLLDGEMERTRDSDGYCDPPRCLSHHPGRPFDHQDRSRASDWPDAEHGRERNWSRDNASQRQHMQNEPHSFDLPPPKRFRYADTHNHYSRNKWHRQSPRGSYSSHLSWRRQEQPSNKEVQALTLHVARLEKDIEDLKGAKNAPSEAEGKHQTEFSAAPSADDTAGDDGDAELTLGPRADSAQQSQSDPTSRSGLLSNESPGGVSQGVDFPPKYDGVGGYLTDPVNQTQQAHSVGACDADGVNPPGQTPDDEASQENDSCYDASTDEEINAPPAEAAVSAGHDHKKRKASSDDRPVSGEKVKDEDSANNKPDVSEDGSNAKREPNEEENENNRPIQNTSDHEEINVPSSECKAGETTGDDERGGDPADDKHKTDVENNTCSHPDQCCNSQEEVNALPSEVAANDKRDHERGGETSDDHHDSRENKNAEDPANDVSEKRKDASNAEKDSINHPIHTSNGDETDEDSVDPVLKEDYDPLGKIAFCCQNCRCWKTSRARYLSCSQIRNNCGNSGGGGHFGNTRLFHRGCCHGDRKNNEDYLSPMTKAINETFKGKKKKKTESRLDTHSKIKKAYNTAKREESRFENEGFEEAKDCSIYSNPIYCDCTAMFAKRHKAQTGPLRVLDLFSGIGSGVVVLKRLQIPIHSIVHVEHDPVAVEVCKSNHQDDGITHHYVEKFEEIYGTNDEPEDEKIRSFLDKYGFIDLLLSGAPCQSYSGLNAARDETSTNAQYLKKVGRLTEKLDHIQSNGENVKDRVLFLSENVVFKNHEHVDRCYLGGLPPICIDAKDFSPCKRNRFYWTNLPAQNPDQVVRIASVASVDELLDEGYRAVARLLQDEDEQSSTPVKANAFLASLSRIDDNRMIKCKLGSKSSKSAVKKIDIETYSIGERERMMGLPAGYVEKPLKRLFNELAEKAFLYPETSEEGKSYRDFLPRKFWHYRKKCHFKFQAASEPPFFQLAISSPQEGRSQPPFYMMEQYAKHLIGNGWSIPVTEHLLKSLTELFADDVAMPTYDKYAYPFPWKPYDSDAT